MSPGPALRVAFSAYLLGVTQLVGSAGCDNAPPASDRAAGRTETPAPPAGVETIRPDRGQAQLMSVAEPWAVWCVSTLIEETRYYRGRSFTQKYYRQRLSEDVATHVWTGVNAGHAVATADGTLVFVQAVHRVVWRSGDGKEVVSEQVEPMIREVYPDGIVVKPGSWDINKTTRGYGAVTFIPFEGRRLNQSRAVEIAPQHVQSLRHQEPLRVGNVFAWAPRGSLEFVDVVTGKRRRTLTPPFPGDYRDDNYAFGFDEQTIVTAYQTFDIATGQIIGKPDSRFRRPQGSPLAVRNGIYYYLRRSKIYATDVNFEKGGEVFVADAPVEPIERTAKGFVLWTGRKWVEVPWLTTLPEPKG